MTEILRHAAVFLLWLLTAPVAGITWLLRRYVEFWEPMPHAGVALHLLVLLLIGVALIVRGDHTNGTHLGPWC